MSQRRVPPKIFLPEEIPAHTRQALTQIYEALSAQVNLTAHDATHISSTQAVGSELVLVDAAAAAVTVNLPPAAQWRDREMHIKKKDSSANFVLIAPYGSETIDEVGTFTISAQYTTYQIMSDGNEWWIV